MTALLWLVGGLTALLVAVHMSRPYATRVRLSAARFFWPATPPTAHRRRIRWANPLRSRPLWLQLPVALLLLAALLLYRQTLAAQPQGRALGIWLVLDTSASMRAQVNGISRFDLALASLGRSVGAATVAAQGEPLCFRLSTLDQAVRHWSDDAEASTVLALAATLQPRALGTDLALLHSFGEAADARQPGCAVTHLVVISDLPAPPPTTGGDAAAAPATQAVVTATLPMLWEGVELTMPNTGITAIDATVDPLSHRVMGVSVHVTAYGPVAATTLEVTSPDGTLQRVAPAWAAAGADEQRWVYLLDQPAPGRYAFHLAAPDGIAHDNDATIEVPAQAGIGVDWRLAASGLPAQLGWHAGDLAPQLRVAPASMLAQLPPDDTPLLLVGAGYGAPHLPAPIVEFADDSALLENVSFEQVERTGLAPLAATDALPEGFVPVLAAGNQSGAGAWLATRAAPRAVYVPGLPGAADPGDETWRLSATLFANAVRWLLQEEAPPSLYSVTTPAAPEPSGTRLALHPEESESLRSSSGPADLGLLLPQPAPEAATPLWPWPVVAAVAILAVERNLGAWKGGGWC